MDSRPPLLIKTLRDQGQRDYLCFVCKKPLWVNQIITSSKNGLMIPLCFSCGSDQLKANMTNQDKLDKLAEIEGFDNDIALLEAFAVDSVCPGICMNDDCDYTTEVEPDCSAGFCENCNDNSVKSAMILAGVI